MDGFNNDLSTGHASPNTIICWPLHGFCPDYNLPNTFLKLSHFKLKGEKKCIASPWVVTYRGIWLPRNVWESHCLPSVQEDVVLTLSSSLEKQALLANENLGPSRPQSSCVSSSYCSILITAGRGGYSYLDRKPRHGQASYLIQVPQLVSG